MQNQRVLAEIMGRPGKVFVADECVRMVLAVGQHITERFNDVSRSFKCIAGSFPSSVLDVVQAVLTLPKARHGHV